MPNSASFNSLDGVPTMYMRWGGGDTEPRQYTFRCRPNFLEALNAWVRYLKEVSAEAGPEYAEMEWITSAGAYVNKPGQHGNGTAFDLDQAKWVDGPLISPIRLDGRPNASIERQRRYYALEATVRAHFRWTLDANYNAAHHDHIHQDFGGMPPVLGTGSSSDTFFVQGMLNAFQDAGLAVDGIWGPLTQGAFDESKDRLNYTGNPHNSTADYRGYLELVASRGFRAEPF